MGVNRAKSGRNRAVQASRHVLQQSRGWQPDCRNLDTNRVHRPRCADLPQCFRASNRDSGHQFDFGSRDLTLDGTGSLEKARRMTWTWQMSYALAAPAFALLAA